MNRRLLLVLLSLLSLGLSGVAQTSAASLPAMPQWGIERSQSDVPGAPQLLKGTFIQQKQTRFMRRPIRSSGTIIVSANQGIIWRTETPVTSTLVISQSHIISIDSQNKRQQLGGASGLNMVFLNALTGNWQGLTEHFSLSVAQQAKQEPQAEAITCVTLMPKSEVTQSALQSIDVCGTKEDIREMHIVEPGGAKSLIQLNLMPYKALSQQEQSLLTP